MNQRPTLAMFIPLLALAGTIVRAAPQGETNAARFAAPPGAIVRCAGYEVLLPAPQSRPVKMHEPFRQRPRSAPVVLEQPRGEARGWGGTQLRSATPDVLPAPPVAPARLATDDAENRSLLDATLPPAGSRDEAKDADIPDLRGWGRLAQDVSALERAARREERSRREAESARSWVDALGIEGEAGPYGMGRGLFDSERERAAGGLFGGENAGASPWRQPEPEPPPSPFVWSLPGD